MVEGLALSAGLLVLMTLMSAWTASQLPDGPVPVHFDIRGRADKLGSRWVALATLPTCYVLLAAFMAWAGFRTPPEEQVDQLVGQSVAGVAILGAHAFIIWLLLRWVRAR
jgi:hypothetical protein